MATWVNGMPFSCNSLVRDIKMADDGGKIVKNEEDFAYCTPTTHPKLLSLLENSISW